MADSIVIFGASGDLTSRKLVPALYRLFAKGRLPEDARIVGVSRSKYEHQGWRDSLRETTAKFAEDQYDGDTWDAFSRNVFYHTGDISKRRLGLSKDAYQAVCAETTHVWHLAAVYNLAIPQSVAYRVNVMGTANILDLCEQSHRLLVIAL